MWGNMAMLRRILTANSVIIALLTATVLLQLSMIYRERGSNRPSRQPALDHEAVEKAPEGARIDITDLPIAGRSDAKVVMVEFSDFECPFCRRYATSTKKELWDRFVSTDKIRYAFVNNPLAIHPNAIFMAGAGVCAARQNRYWEMQDRLFEAQPKDRAAVSSAAAAIA